MQTRSPAPDGERRGPRLGTLSDPDPETSSEPSPTAETTTPSPSPTPEPTAEPDWDYRSSCDYILGDFSQTRRLVTASWVTPT
jgi:hypothetical protein